MVLWLKIQMHLLVNIKEQFDSLISKEEANQTCFKLSVLAISTNQLRTGILTLRKNNNSKSKSGSDVHFFMVNLICTLLIYKLFEFDVQWYRFIHWNIHHFVLDVFAGVRLWYWPINHLLETIGLWKSTVAQSFGFKWQYSIISFNCYSKNYGHCWM